jgi:hypothetical protein
MALAYCIGMHDVGRIANQFWYVLLLESPRWIKAGAAYLSTRSSRPIVLPFTGILLLNISLAYMPNSHSHQIE